MSIMEHPVKIGRYQVLELLGQGGMGLVYKARDPNIDRLVALKVMKPSLAADEEAARDMLLRFRREAAAAGTIQHPNIVSVYDADEDNGTPFIVMEYVEGEPLDAILERAPLSLAGRAAAIVGQAARALHHAHLKGVIHRDVKPANIILCEDGQVKVMDFGIARLAGSELTQTGMVLGSPSYMSPEQITGGEIDGRTDVFSLGVVLYQLLTGEKPFLGENPNTIAYKVVRTDPLSPSEINPAVNPKMDRVLAAALAKHPDIRYQNAEELANDLDRVTRGEEPLASEPETTRIGPAADLGTSIVAVASKQNETAAVGTPPFESEPPAKPDGNPWARGLLMAKEGLRLDPRYKWALTGAMAVALVLTIIALFTGNTPSLEQAEAYLAEGSPEKAVSVLEGLRDRDPENARILFLLGLAYGETGKTDLAIASFMKSIAVSPEGKDDPRLVLALLRAPQGLEAEMAIKFIKDQVGRRARDTLKAALEDPDRNARWNAYQALRAQGYRADLVDLHILDLAEEDCETRKQAAQELGKIGGPKALAALESAATREENRKPCMENAVNDAIKKNKSKSNKTSGGKDGQGVDGVVDGIRGIFKR